jgi:hypothetical protein
MGFSSVYSNGGQNAIYTSDLGAGGGEGGGGGSLEGQMSAMSSFDPSSWINILRQDQRDIANNRMFNELAMMQRRKSAEDDARAAAQAAMAKERQRSEFAAHRDPVMQAQRQAAIAQSQALSRPAPTKVTNIGMSPAFNSINEDAMTGAQRQMFLPQNATIMQDYSQWYGRR